jgi:hypothetical protein
MSFKLDMNRYPASFEELVKPTDPKWRGPYLSKQTIPQDPWARDYVYKTRRLNFPNFDQSLFSAPLFKKSGLA